MNRNPHIAMRTLLSLGLLLTLCLSAFAQNRPDLVWMRGGHGGELRSVVFSRDGALVVTAGREYTGGGSYNAGSVKIYRHFDTMLLRTFFLNSIVNSVALSTDGKLVAAGSNDNLVRVWRISDGALLYTLSGFTAAVNAVAFSIDGTLIAGGAGDNSVRLWRVSNGTLLRTLIGHTSAVLSMVFSQDGQHFASCGTDGIIVRRVSDWQLRYPKISVGTVDIDISSDGQTLAGASYFNTTPLRLYRVSDGLEIANIDSGVTKVAFSPDNQFVAYDFHSNGSRIRVRRVTDGAFVRDIMYENISDIKIIAFSPQEGMLVAGSGRNGGNIRLDEWRVSDGTLARQLFMQADPGYSIALSPDGSYVASPGGARPTVVRIRRTSDGMLLRDLNSPTGDLGSASAISPDGNYLAATGVSNGQYLVHLWQTSDWSYLGNLPGGGNWAVEFSKDGRFLAACGYSGSLRFWRVEDFTDCTLSGQAHSGIVSDVAFSSDGNLLASCGYDDSRIKLWNTTTCTLIQTINTEQGRLFSIDISPDARTLASCGSNGNIKLWDIATGSLIRTLAHSGEVRTVVFSPNGQTLTSISEETMKTWLILDGSLLQTNDAEIRSSGQDALEFSRDGKFIFYGRSDASIVCALNPYRNAVLPNKGGNTGNVTFKLITPSTFPVPDGATVTLRDGVNPDISVNATSLNDHVLTGTFALRGAEVGVRDVVIAKPNGETQTYPQAFTIEAGKLPELSVEVIAREQHRVGAIQNYNIEIRNVGNVDATTADLRIQFPKFMQWWVDSDPVNSVESSDEITSLAIPFDVLPAGGLKVVSTRLKLPPDLSYVGKHLPVWIWANPTEDVRLVLYGGATEDLVIRKCNGAGDVLSIFGEKDNRGIPIRLTSTFFRSADGIEAVIQNDAQSRPVLITMSDGTLINIGWLSQTTALVTFRLSDGTAQGPFFIDTEDETEGRAGSGHGRGRFGTEGPCPNPRDVDKGLEPSLPWPLILRLARNPLVRLGAAGIVAARSPAVALAVIIVILAAQPAHDEGRGGFGDSSGSGTGGSGGICPDGAAAVDPNELIGPQGFDTVRWVSGQQPLTYITLFENMAVPGSIDAQAVDVVDYLDPVSLDLTTVTLGAIRFGDKVVEPTPDVSLPVGMRQFYYEVPLPERNLTVRITATLDMLTGELLWRYVACDAEGNCPPLNPFLGFLPPNVNAPEGEGSVTVSIMPKPGVLTGTVSQARALITFDSHFGLPGIAPAPWLNTLDNDKPVSRVALLPAVTSTTTIPLTLSVSDVGSGVREATVYVSDNGGSYTPAMTFKTDTQATFLGESGHTYAFKIRATDNVGNIEEEHTEPDAVTAVQANVFLRGSIAFEECVLSPSRVTMEFRPRDGSETFTRNVELRRGTFTLNIPAKRYHVAVKGSKWLRKTLALDGRQADSRQPNNFSVLLLAGDANDDNSVDVLDLDLLIQAFDTTNGGGGNYNSSADFNCDESVDVLDLDLLLRNFDRQGDP